MLLYLSLNKADYILTEENGKVDAGKAASGKLFKGEDLTKTNIK